MTSPSSVLAKTARPMHLILGIGLLSLAAATVVKNLVSPSSLDAGPWPIAVLLGAYLLLERANTYGWFSIAGVTAVLSVLAFWLKWVAGSEPRPQLRVLAFDNDGAIRACGIFVLVFAVAWRFTVRRDSDIHTAKLPHTEFRSIARATAWIAFVAGLGLIAARYMLAEMFHIGVPGIPPTDTGALRPFLSLLYYVSIIGPLCIASVLAVWGPRRASWIPAIVVLVAFSTVGAAIGYRGYAVLAFATMAFALSGRHPGWRTNAKRSNNTRNVIVLSISFAAMLFGLTMALASRAQNQDAKSSDTVFSFLTERVGGLDYLSPVIVAIDRSGPRLSFIDPGTWDAFMRVDVYGFPSAAATGVSATLPGLLYGLQGTWGLLIGGVVLGIAAGWLDNLCLRLSTIGPAGTIVTLGAVLSWTNLLLEGTLRNAIFQGLVFALLAVFVAHLGQGRNTGIELQDGQRDREPRPTKRSHGT